MKAIFSTLILLLSLSASAQFKYLQSGNYILRFDTTAISHTPMSEGPENSFEFRSIANGNLYVKTYYESVFLFNAALAAGNISQISTTGVYLITCPTTITTTKGILLGQLYLEYSTNTHTVGKINNDIYTLTRISDGRLICEIYPTRNNAIFWHVAPTTIQTLGSGIKRIVVP